MAPQRFREQFDQIQRSMPDVPLAMGPDDAAEFLYEKGVVLARDGEEARVVEDTVREHFTALAGLDAGRVRRAGPETNRSGITRIQVGDPGEGTGGDPAVAHALRSLRAFEGRAGRRLVSRNHVVSIAVNSCPGDEPVPVPRTERPNPAPADAPYDPGSAVGVLVVDTGLMADHRSYPLLAHTRGDLQVKECDDEGVLCQYVGHGTFIAGLLAAVAPNTDITVRNTLNDAGAILESEFGEKLFDAVEEGGWPDVISLSAGTSNGRTDGLLGVHAFMEELRARGTLLVAAAGNNASATPFWPAAYADLPGWEDSVLSVGALRADGEHGACFSNHGGWVKVYAPGERLTSALTGIETPVPYVYQHSTFDACRFGFGYACTCQTPRHTGLLSEPGDAPAKPDQVMFEGYAQWSGTSFATPVVAGLIASHMTAHRQTDARVARKALLAANTEYAEVRGAHVPALLPPTWRPVPVGPPDGAA
ncbi:MULTISPECIES: S8/S53 family peptidase [Streptomyces]|uniref:Subtilisin family serine protease n=2 Tax=Streptomyces TaxID=1883 RepID=A0ABT9LQ19_STRGD|nr:MULTISPECIES: S8/S53 family peptidase [Streptomyces]MDP9685629.1 subtilisin family serine protease [Streptomyces griseoviridis]GGS88847.1 protease [Streptomyces griseoviridis]GGU55601.1 protease [Streptomyces daghestanicus]GHI34921.1 protease [Streptomyces daghestanicus]